MSIPHHTLSHTPLRDHTADRRMAMLAAAALFVGAAGTGGAWLLLNLIALATNLFWNGKVSVAPMTMGLGAPEFLLVLAPVLGSLIIGVMARFGSEKIRGHGIPEAIEAILYGESRMSLKVALLKPLSSAISIGSGGPFGAEGPIIMTGGAIGSLFAQCFHLSAAERKTLLVAGAAAGMTAIFGTPLAAILLAVEVLLFEWKPRSFVPVVMAVLVAVILRPLLIGSGAMFPAQLIIPSGLWTLPAALGLGLATGVEAGLLSAALYRIEDFFHRLPVHWMWWPALGALVVGGSALVDRRILGAGYGNIQALLDGSMLLQAVILLLVMKAIAWLVALGSGTSGGVLAPLLTLGGALGALAGFVLPGGPAFWALLGMAGIMSGAMRAPLTGALFAAELTGQFRALPFTMACAIGAYAVSVLVMRRSILTEKISRRGRHILQEFSVDPHDLIQAGQIMTPDPVTLPETMRVSEVITFFASGAKFRSYPVIDAAGRLSGLVSRNDALAWQEGTLPADTTLGETLSDFSQPHVQPDTPIGVVADIILETGNGRVPVIAANDRRVVGIVTRHDLLKARYARRQDEHSRSRPIALPRLFRRTD
ncbi:MAG: chloride channel protein [Alphaproteobacteria bacterium]|nr:chloride channel protein [Alphaproteobacteria bacterium]